MAPGLTVDGQGNVYVAMSSKAGISGDYATIKYDTNGNEKWLKHYNGPGNDWDVPRALAVDGQGNIYVTGYSYGADTGYDYATIKYREIGDMGGAVLLLLME